MDWVCKNQNKNKIERTFILQILVAIFLFTPNFMIFRGFTGHNTFNNKTFNFILTYRFFLLLSSVSGKIYLIEIASFFLSLWTIDSTANYSHYNSITKNRLDWCTNALNVWTELYFVSLVPYHVIFNLNLLVCMCVCLCVSLIAYTYV